MNSGEWCSYNFFLIFLLIHFQFIHNVQFIWQSIQCKSGWLQANDKLSAARSTGSHDNWWLRIDTETWHHGMGALSTLLAICEGNPISTSGFPSRRGPVMWILMIMIVLLVWTSCWTICRVSIVLACCEAFQQGAWPLTYESSEKIVFSGIILCMHPANERRRYFVMSSLIGRAHTQNNPSILCGISKAAFEIPHQISYLYIKRCVFYSDVKN